MKTLDRLLTLLFVLALPLFLVTTNLSGAANSPSLYEYGFGKYQVGEKLGLSPQELSRVARELISYLNSEQENTGIKVNGQELFNEREETHLRDVRGLIRLNYTVQWVSLGYGLVYVLWSLLGGPLAQGLLWGSGATLILFLALGLGMLVGFDQLFLGFHLIGFRNSYWMLDPATDRLIVLFPEGFFYDAALLVAAATIIEALLLGGLVFLIRRAGLRL